MKEDPVATCPECGSPVKRLLYPVGVVFKGSGWYINDSRKPDTSDTASAKSVSTPSSASTSGDSTSSESTPAESKTEAAPKAETATAAASKD